MKKTHEKIKYQVTIFIFFMAALLLRLPRVNELVGFRTTLYGITYKYGFIERAFMGSIFRVFTDHLTTEMIYYAFLVLLIMLFFMLSGLFAKIIADTTGDSKTMSKILALLYLSSPITIIRFCYARNYTSFDGYIILVFFICALIIDKPKLKYFIPLLCFVALSIHHACAFTYYMFVFGVLLYQWYKSAFSKKEGIFFGTTVFSSIILFVYYQFIGIHVPFNNLYDLKADIQKFAHIPIEDFILRRYYVTAKEYFMKVCIHGEDQTAHIDINIKERLLAFVFVMIFLVPLVLVFITVWKNTISFCENKTGKWVYRFFMLSPILSIPIFVTAIDWDRWMIGIFLTQILFIYYLIKNNDHCFKNGLQKTYESIKGTKEFLLYIYMTILGLFYFYPMRFNISATISEFVTRMIDSIIY